MSPRMPDYDELRAREAQAQHTREVIAVHEGYGEEAICSQCYVYWPCKAVAAGA